MDKISCIELSGVKREKQLAREALVCEYNLAQKLESNIELMPSLRQVSVRFIDRKVKHGEDLSFVEAFCGMCYVLAATNRRCFQTFRSFLGEAYGGDLSEDQALVIAVAFLQLMAAKESLSGLTADEVAGLACAGMMDSMIHLNLYEVVETAGMGGDKGFAVNGSVKKSINLSTLSSLVLVAAGAPAVKHGSYGNTSAVGSTEAIELFGAHTTMSSKQVATTILSQSGFCFFDAHWSKTLHDLSHLLMMETINHIVGPMTPPIARQTIIHKVMGVNEKVHPQVIAEAYAKLHALGKQCVGGVAIVCGLDEAGTDLDLKDLAGIKTHVIVDELSPYTSLVALTRGPDYLGTFKLRPIDFGLEIDPVSVRVSNNQSEIQAANVAALTGADSSLANYLAMNAALGLYVSQYLSRPDALGKEGPNRRYLRECLQRCREAILNGGAKSVLAAYVTASGGQVQLA